MSRKKHKDITKSIITDTQLQEIIRTNEEIRKLKITHKPFIKLKVISCNSRHNNNSGNFIFKFSNFNNDGFE